MNTRVRLYVVWIALSILVIPICGAAQNSNLDFEIIAPTTGTINYAVGGGALVGSSISVDQITGVPLGPSAQACVGCVFDFTTGDLSGASGTSWTFAAGGSFTVSGSVPAVGASGVLLSGSFSSGSVFAIGGPAKIFGAEMLLNIVHPDLAIFFGLPTSLKATVNLSFSATGTSPATFVSSAVFSGDLITLPCGNGVLEGSEECDGADDAACPGLCQSTCTCGSPVPPTDTPTVGTPTMTPTPVPNHALFFGIIAPTSGTIDYAIVGGALVGSNIQVDAVYGLPSALSVEACVGCVLTFTTGNLTTTDATTWSFAAGGSINLTGSVPTAGASGVLLSGWFSSATVVALGGSFKVLGAQLVLDAVNADLLTHFGLPMQDAGVVNISFLTAPAPPATFSGSPLSGDLVTSACGDGTKSGGEQCDGGDDASCPGTCQPDCTCPAPDTPTPTPTVETPTATATSGPNVDLNFAVIAPTTGTINYVVLGGPLVGTDIAVDELSGVGAGPVAQPCVGCVINFTTGDLTASDAMSWSFAAGGSFTLTGSVPAAGASGTLVTGSFGTPTTVLTLAASLKLVAGTLVIDTINADLLTFFGLTTSTNGGLNLSFIASGTPPGTFLSSSLGSGDVVTNHTCGNGVVNGSEECDPGDDAACPGLCQSNCTCAPPDSPTATRTATVTATATATPTATPSAVCGNGVVELGEDCDGGPTCDVNCTFIACGNGSVSAGESCDDGNTVDGDGCSASCQDTAAPEAATSPSLGSGQTITTDVEADGATSADPVETTITMGAGVASVTIDESSSAAPAPGYELVGQQIEITLNCPVSPCPSPSEPLVLEFRIDASRIPGDVDENTIALFRDGVMVAPCAGAPGVADPDPCIDVRQRFADGDIGLRALTSQASVWSFGRAVCAPTALDCGDPGRSILKVKRPTVPAGRKLLWKWLQGTIDGPADFGDPLNETTVTLCVYDGSNPVQSHVIAPGGDCGDHPCWKAVGTKGFKYTNQAGNADGITKVLLKSGTGKAKLLVRGKGDKLILPAVPDKIYAQTASITVQLVTDNGGCWQAIYDAPAQMSSAEQFKDELP